MECIDDTITYCTEQLEKIPFREKVKHLTAFGTEIVLPTKFFRIGKILCARIRPMVRAALQVIQDEQVAVEVAGAAGENLLMKVTEGIQEAETAVQEIIGALGERPGLGPLVPEIADSYEHIVSAIAKVIPNRIHHILTLQSGKHAWHKVISDEITWEKVKNIIAKVMCEGAISPEKTVFKKSCIINAEIVDVVFVPRSDGTISIVDAWVRTI